MKCLCLCAAALLALSAEGEEPAQSQAIAMRKPPESLDSQSFTNIAPNIEKLLRNGTNIFQAMTNFTPSELRKFFKDHVRAVPSSPRLAPGLYETRPYTMIVQSPAAHADDAMIFPKQTAGPDRMPQGKPKLEFVPRAPAADKAEPRK